jgi:hypothetical protein
VARDFTVLRTVTTGSWLRTARRCGPPWRFTPLTGLAHVCESEAADWNAASLGVSRSLGYELNGVARMSWGGKQETVQRVRLTPESFRRPDWQLRVDGHEPTAKFLLGIPAG